eukprot:763403-Hanusia_phi.AAC.5
MARPYRGIDPVMKVRGVRQRQHHRLNLTVFTSHAASVPSVTWYPLLYVHCQWGQKPNSTVYLMAPD